MKNATPIEVELKLALAPSSIEALECHPLLAARPPLTQTLANTYFDTPTHALASVQIALRLRKVDGRVLQTVKTAGQGGGGLSSRQEWEWPVTHDGLDQQGLAALPPFQGELAEQIAYLTPTLRTDFTRRSWQLDWQGSHIELALDKGEIESGAYTTPICEVELELKNGAPEALWSLAIALAEKVPLRPSDSSKATRGGALRAQQWPLPDAHSPAQWLHRATLALDAFHDSQTPDYLQSTRDALQQLTEHPALPDDLKELAGALPQALDANGQPSIIYGVTLLTLSHRLALQSALS
ncbi:CYTH domain-containing protein [Vreelandella populi]|uniref:CYTH domain-containing protein n=1 Tax=Vreelandella populi TaxID=2498858 RepID=A0A3S0WJS0_9GAMM|nr:CYTH domain-containing protein [Halomonas populi]RUR39356.1 CYTH domain-containing protein [Halomonas populi]RUR46471.1 CYTH domain-containing protein [Halomonas populi]